MGKPKTTLKTDNTFNEFDYKCRNEIKVFHFGFPNYNSLSNDQTFKLSTLTATAAKLYVVKVFSERKFLMISFSTGEPTLVVLVFISFVLSISIFWLSLM